MVREPNLKDVRAYWDDNVIGLEASSKEAGSDAFFEEYTAYGAERYADAVAFYRFDAFRGKRLLEIGCGLGRELELYTRNGAWTVGLDLSYNALKLATKYFRYRKAKLRALSSNAEQLPFPDEVFDVVVSLGVLHHTPDTEKAISEVHRILRPGGEALIMLYNRWSWFNLLATLSGVGYEKQEADAPIVKMYSRRQIVRMFRRYRDIRIVTGCPPQPTIKRRGILAKLYNSVFVRCWNLLPSFATRRFGWHHRIHCWK
ncbi:MAG: class I SAM-dependent methyltransferase [Phycisphaerales bacterium]|nr:MAG: class I SAM-dependent methyltransferase [Phycisphaerales bacterium]